MQPTQKVSSVWCGHIAHMQSEPARGAPSQATGDFYSEYLKLADMDDQAMLESWLEDMDGLLIFVRHREMNFD